MEEMLVFAIPGLLGFFLLRLLLQPVRWALKFAAHGACGFLCLWLLNLVSGITGIYLPLNAVTVLIAGFLGLPGIALVALLQLG